MITPSALQMLLMVLTGWLERREREALAYLIAGVEAGGFRWEASGASRAAQSSAGEPS